MIVGRCANYMLIVVAIELTIGRINHGLLLARFMSMHCWHAFNKRLGQQTWAESSTYKLDIMEGKICGLYYTAKK